MYISTAIDTSTRNSFQLEDLFERVLKRDLPVDFFSSDSNNNGDTQINYTVPIAVGVLVGFVVFLIMFLVSFFCWCRPCLKRRKLRKQNEIKAREKRDLLLNVKLAESGGDYKTGAPDSMKNGKLRVEEEEEQAGILKPSGAVLHPKNSLVSSLNTKYEYEPLPQYELIQPNVPDKRER